MQPAELARSYYETIDAHEYDALSALLDEDFVHERPDRTLEGRDTFVSFMRDDRPRTETTHRVDAVLPGPGGVAVTGRLDAADGSTLFRFVDVFTVRNAHLQHLVTFAGES
ncbi:MAG: nuclear transport factor 2 family protein [Halanaeroarchaeum sp.]